MTVNIPIEEEDIFFIILKIKMNLPIRDSKKGRKEGKKANIANQRKKDLIKDKDETSNQRSKNIKE